MSNIRIQISNIRRQIFEYPNILEYSPYTEAQLRWAELVLILFPLHLVSRPLQAIRRAVQLALCLAVSLAIPLAVCLAINLAVRLSPGRPLGNSSGQSPGCLPGCLKDENTVCKIYQYQSWLPQTDRYTHTAASFNNSKAVKKLTLGF